MKKPEVKEPKDSLDELLAKLMAIASDCEGQAPKALATIDLALTMFSATIREAERRGEPLGPEALTLREDLTAALSRYHRSVAGAGVH